MLHLDGDNYMIEGESAGFANRQKSIFDQLDAVKVKPHQSKAKKGPSSDGNTEGTGAKLMRTSTGMICTIDFSTDVVQKGRKINFKHFKGQESIFKRPEVPPPRFKQRVPDFQINPHKWVKYSLCDVTLDDMSDRSNTAAAMSFLNEIKSRKESIQSEEMEVDPKISFKKPIRPQCEGAGSSVTQISKDDSPGEDGTSYFRGSKLIMPEYVIGEKKKSKKQTSKSDSNVKNKSKEIKLNHLIEFEDDSEDICI